MNAKLPIVASVDDVLRISAANPGWRVERLADQSISLAPPTGSATARRNARLTARLDAWASANDFVAFDSNGGFTLPDGSIVAPDAALVRRSEWDSLAEHEQEGFAPLVPTVVVELISRTDRVAEVRGKLQRLRALGVAFAVLIDPYRHEVWSDGIPPANFDLNLTEIAR